MLGSGQSDTITRVEVTTSDKVVLRCALFLRGHDGSDSDSDSELVGVPSRFQSLVNLQLCSLPSLRLFSFMEMHVIGGTVLLLLMHFMQGAVTF